MNATRLERPSLRRSVRTARVAFDPGDHIGDHVVVRALGSGGFGAVYEVEHAVLGVRAALKLLHARHLANASIRARFVREAQLVETLRHPNIIAMYERGEFGDRWPYFVMELLDGTDVGRLIDRRGRLLPSEVAAIVGPVCDALAAAHGVGIIHRDLKPSNVFVTCEGRVVVLDFGIAKPTYASSLTRTSDRIGTPAYMAPEQAQRKSVDARTDVYLVGALAYHLLTGQPPFEHAARIGPPQRPSRIVPSLPAVLDEVVLHAMSADPSERYPNVRALQQAFSAAVEDRPASTTATCAIHLAVAESSADDAALRAVLDDCLARLTSHGFVLATATPNSLLVARKLDEDVSSAQLSTLASELARMAACAVELTVEVAAQTGIAEWRGDRPVGGPLLTLDWLP